MTTPATPVAACEHPTETAYALTRGTKYVCNHCGVDRFVEHPLFLLPDVTWADIKRDALLRRPK